MLLAMTDCVSPNMASDHVGLYIKNTLKEMLSSRGIEYVDLGTRSKNRIDYPVFAKKLCEKIREDIKNKGILICGTGIGMNMIVNRFKNIRAALCVNEYMAEMAIRHNNANVLCLGARFIGEELANPLSLSFFRRHLTPERKMY